MILCFFLDNVQHALNFSYVFLSLTFVTLSSRNFRLFSFKRFLLIEANQIKTNIQNSNRYKFHTRAIPKRSAAIVLYGAATGYSLLMNRYRAI